MDMKTWTKLRDDSIKILIADAQLLFIGSHQVDGTLIPGYFSTKVSKVSDAIQHQRKKEDEYSEKKQKEKLRNNKKIGANESTIHKDIPEYVIHNLTKTR